MLKKSQFDLNQIPGVQEIEDLAAESFSGGNGFEANRTFTGGGSSRYYTPLNGWAFGGEGRYVSTLNIRNHDGHGRYFSILRRLNNIRSGDGVEIERFWLDSGATRTVTLRTRDSIAIGQHDSPEGARGRANNVMNAYAPSGACNSRCGFGSDRRIKTDIKVVAFLEELGIKLYSWAYINDDPTRYVGVMAQDLLAQPALAHAVVISQEGEFAGYYAVNYQTLGLRMTTEAEWQEQGTSAVVKQPLAVCV